MGEAEEGMTDREKKTLEEIFDRRGELIEKMNSITIEEVEELSGLDRIVLSHAQGYRDSFKEDWDQTTHDWLALFDQEHKMSDKLAELSDDSVETEEADPQELLAAALEYLKEFPPALVEAMIFNRIPLCETKDTDLLTTYTGLGRLVVALLKERRKG